MGTARGIHPGRVIWVHNPNATSWDGSTGFWSDDANTSRTAVNRMFSNAIRRLAETKEDGNAWDAIFRYFNQRHGKGNVGYQTGEKIAIKINMINCANHGNPGNASYNSPQLIEAVLKQLVMTIGVRPEDITVYDASNFIPGTIYDRCSTGPLAGVRFEDRVGGDGRIMAQRDATVMVHHAHPDVPPRWLPTCITQAAYVINLAHLKAHYLTGVTLCAKNHFGSTWVQADPNFPDSWRGREGFWPGNEIHGYINAYDTMNGQSSFHRLARPMGSYNPLVELMGHPDLGEKTLLFIIDGLYAGKDASAPIGKSPRWQSAPFNNDWTSSILVSQDGVAIDSVALDFLRSEPAITCVADSNGYSTADDYLHEAATADNPPSGTLYNPSGTRQLSSLGVHEHWNNPVDKKYSRNLHIAEGIELIQIPADMGTADLNQDHSVNLLDMTILSSQWLSSPGTPSADIVPEGGDNVVDLLDLSQLASDWLIPIPEN